VPYFKALSPYFLKNGETFRHDTPISGRQSNTGPPNTKQGNYCLNACVDYGAMWLTLQKVNLNLQERNTASRTMTKCRIYSYSICRPASYFFSLQCHHMSLMDFMVSPPGCGRSVTDLWGWDAHEAQLRCPDEVDGDIWIWSTRRSLRPKFY
jgi:hypothetical protein